MKLTHIFAVSAVLAIVFSCTKNQETDIQTPGGLVLTASLEASLDTKTTLSELQTDEHGVKFYSPLWSEGDEIAVFPGKAAGSGTKFTLLYGAGTKEASFTGDAAGNSFVAFYPYSMDPTINQPMWGNPYLRFKFPAVQQEMEGSFAANSFPMYATSLSAERPDQLSFKNLAAVLKLTLYGNARVSQISIYSEDKCLSGYGDIWIDEANPESGLRLTASSDADRTVILQCNGRQLSTTEGTDFFVVLPAQDYTGSKFHITVSSGSINRELTISRDFTMYRSQVTTYENKGVLFNEDGVDGTIITYEADINQVYDFQGRNPFNANILSHTISNGQGIITFDRILTRIEDNAFAGSGGLLHSLSLPNSVEYIGSHVLAGQTSLLSLKVPKALAAIGPGMLEGSAVESFTCDDEHMLSPHQDAIILNSGNAQDRLAAVAPGVEEFDVPAGIRVIEPYAFAGCEYLRTITSSNVSYPVEEGILIEDATKMAIAMDQDVASVTIPSGVRALSPYLSYDGAVTSVSIPASVESIDGTAFILCDGLTTISGDRASSDGRLAVIDGTVELFARGGLSSYEVPGGIISIGDKVFAGSELTEVTLPSSIREFSGDAFNNTPGLTTINLKATVPPVNATGALPEGLSGSLQIFVPAESLSAYLTSADWVPFVAYLKPGSFGGDGVSSDYSKDGLVTTLQEASSGNGIDVVILGDGYNDTDVNGSTYSSRMTAAMNAFFAIEPYKSYKNYFNVYSVNLVSPTSGYASTATHPSALQVSFPERTTIVGNDDLAMEYALKAMGGDGKRLDEALIIVVCNNPVYAGTCYMYYSDQMDGSYNIIADDYSSGTSVAYVPLGRDEAEFAAILQHEAGGHGFAKLLDEYGGNAGAIPSSVITSYEKMYTNHGWCKNVSFNNLGGRWAEFIADGDYPEVDQPFEGAATYDHGAWRPTEDSAMRTTGYAGGFNAPSRYAILYRIHKLALGDSLSYADFKAIDQTLSAPAAPPMAGPSARRAHPAGASPAAPLSRPVIRKR